MAGEKARPVTVEVLDDLAADSTALVVSAPAVGGLPWLAVNVEPDASLPFGALYAHSYGEHQRQMWAGLWEEAIERWLHSGRRRSENTRRAYRFAVLEFRRYLRERHAVYGMWQVDDHIVQAWLGDMQAEGLAKRTIATRLAALSSLYQFCSSTKAMMGGREVSLFVDAYGSTRMNPFAGSAVERPKVEQFSDVIGVPNEAYSWIIEDLRSRTPSAANLRNLALLLAFGLNGWRNEEVISMTWGKIAPNSQRKGEFTYRWTGKARDGAEEKRSLPKPIYDAIVAYLKADGRWNPGGADHIQDDEYIWKPVRVHGCANFGNVRRLAENRHITQSTCNGILNSALRRYFRQAAERAGLDSAAAREYAATEAGRYSIHSLRHMFAWNVYKGSGNDIYLASKLLGHKSLNTTRVYLEHLQEPADLHSALVAKQLGLSL